MNVRHELASTGLPSAPGKILNGWWYASCAKFEGQGPAETDRKITIEPWPSMQNSMKTNKIALRSEWRSALETCLTELTFVRDVGFGDLSGVGAGGTTATIMQKRSSGI